MKVFPAPHLVSVIHSPSVTPTISTPFVIHSVGGDSDLEIERIGFRVYSRNNKDKREHVGYQKIIAIKVFQFSDNIYIYIYI